MTAEDVANLYTALLEDGVQLWLGGGWGVDALVQRETRPHKDLDALVAFDDLPALARSLSRQGFTLKEVWEENLWVACSKPLPLIGRTQLAIEVATAFVLEETSRELDLHVVRFNEHGHGVPAWSSDFIFPLSAFGGRGSVAGTRVRCLSAETQLALRTGYDLQEKDRHDVRLLQEVLNRTHG